MHSHFQGQVVGTLGTKIQSELILTNSLKGLNIPFLYAKNWLRACSLEHCLTVLGKEQRREGGSAIKEIQRR